MALSSPQLKTLLWIYWAYVCCYLVRKNYPLLLPDLNSHGLLTTSQAGIVASIFEAVVGIVKFFCGVFVDGTSSPGMLLSQCLLVAGCSCLGMQLVFWYVVGSSAVASTSRVMLVAAFWSINGMGQAVAWPALARVFMDWFPDPATRGTWYSILATNQNLGGTVAPKLYPPLMSAFGWDAALYGPALITIVYAILMMNPVFGLKSAPSDEVRAGSDDTPASPVKSKKSGAVECTPSKSTPHEESTATPEKDLEGSAEGKALAKPGFVQTFTHLCSLPSFMCLCIAYIPVMCIRISLGTWTAIMLEDQGMSLAIAASCLSAMEVGGFVGGMAGGFLSDLCGGRRGPVMCSFSLMCCPLCLAVRALMLHPGGADAGAIDVLAAFGVGGGSGIFVVERSIALSLVFFLVGFFSFPPHSLIGLTSRELAPASMRSTAGCVAKAVGQLGAAAAGWPLEQLAKSYGWGVVGYVNAVCGITAALVFLPLWTFDAKSVQKKSKDK